MLQYKQSGFQNLLVKSILRSVTIVSDAMSFPITCSKDICANSSESIMFLWSTSIATLDNLSMTTKIHLYPEVIDFGRLVTMAMVTPSQCFDSGGSSISVPGWVCQVAVIWWHCSHPVRNFIMVASISGK